MANGSVTAEDFVRDLRRHQSDEELLKIRRYFKEGSGDDFIGVRMHPRSYAMIGSAATLLVASLAIVTVTLIATD